MVLSNSYLLIESEPIFVVPLDDTLNTSVDVARKVNKSPLPSFLTSKVVPVEDALSSSIATRELAPVPV